MKEKDFMKKVTDINIPDIENVRMNVIKNHKKEKKYFYMKRLIPTIVCLCVFIILIKVIPNFHKANTATVQEENIISSVFFNDMQNDIMTDNKLYFDSEKTYEKQLTLDEVISYLGRDVRPTFLPKGLNDYTKEYPNHYFKIIYNNANTVAFDQFYFSYKADFESEEYNPLEKQLHITVSKNKILDCALYMSDKDMKKSSINEQELLLGKRQLSYGPYTIVEEGPNIPTGYYDLFVAEFLMDDIHFKITADNFTEEEFINTLASIIK